ncbi:MAG: tetratricopeptide repeat protein [Candidatus Omnitrophota bacterium]
MANRFFSIVAIAMCLLFFPANGSGQLGVGYREGRSVMESPSVRNSKKTASGIETPKKSTSEGNGGHTSTPPRAKSKKKDSTIPYSERYRENYEEILLRKNLMGSYRDGMVLGGRNMEASQWGAAGELGRIGGTSNSPPSNAAQSAGGSSASGVDSQWVRMMIQPPYPLWIQEALRPAWPLYDSSAESLAEEEGLEDEQDYLQYDLSPSGDVITDRKEESSSPDLPSSPPENLSSDIPAPAPSMSNRDSGPVMQLVRQGDALFQRRQYREAALEYGSAALHYPQAKPIAVRLAFAQFANGQYSQAGKTLQKAMDQAGGLPLIKQTIDEIYATDKDFQYQLYQLAKQAQTSPDEDSRNLYRALLAIR